ncbi:hypothetical protein [Paenibacillus agricola]|uniref:Heat induced stress protein YflT n=1 Tax=Paenibacillus agricola TaxID=2716264 RepID=A0ABX0J9U7_9BACL|nr:hypothetical protein [Paenibacillus agricola]NHN30954.1 hypothetical protein [Paenibacillus agricola]
MNQLPIQAYFQSQTAAQSVEAKLKALRALDVQIDRVDSLEGIAGADPTLSALSNAYGAAFHSSELTSGPYDEGQGNSSLLKAVINESTYEQALRVIREGGGVV